MSKQIPGYTGFRPGQNFSEIGVPTGGVEHSEVKRHQVPGYSGFVSGVKAENVFASSFGKTTKASMAGDIVRGAEPLPEHRFMSTTGNNYVD